MTNGTKIGGGLRVIHIRVALKGEQTGRGLMWNYQHYFSGSDVLTRIDYKKLANEL